MIPNSTHNTQKIYGSTNDGTTNILELYDSNGILVSSINTDGVLVAQNLDNKIDNIISITKEPTGFVEPENVVISYNSTTRKITVTGTTTAYYQGNLITELVSGYESVAHTDQVGIYYLYYNGADIVFEGSFPGFDELLISIVNYNATYKFANRECHGFMQWQSHQEAHYNIGTYRTSGGDISGITLLSNTAANRRPDISACTIYDEDLKTINSSLITKKYSQRYISGTNAINYTLQADDIVPLLVNRPYYNSFTTPNYGQTLMPNDSMMTIWVYEIPVSSDTSSQEYRHVFVQGQSITQATGPQANALTAAYNAELLKTENELYLGLSSVLATEYVCIQKFIIQYTNNNWSIRGSIKLTGTKISQVNTINGNYLSSVAIDSNELTGDGTVLSPLGINQNFLVNNSDTNGLMSFTDKSKLDIILSSSYTPTLTKTTNITTATLGAANYIRVGSYVIVNIDTTITPTSAGSCVLNITLPINSNFDSVGSDVIGHITPRATDFTQKYIEAETTNDTVNVIFTAASTSAIHVYITFIYIIK